MTAICVVSRVAGAQKVASEEGIAFTVTDMAVKRRLRAIALVFLMTFQCVPCQQQ